MMINNETRHNLKENINRMIDNYTMTLENGQKPGDAINAMIAGIGYDETIRTIAALVNTVGAWDQRISDTNRTWSADKAPTRDELAEMGIYTPSAIHQCHIDQLADAARRATKPAEEEHETPEEDTHTDTAAKLEEIAQNAAKMANSRSAWGRGVYAYAVDLLDDLKTAAEEDPHALDTLGTIQSALLNGAEDWSRYSWGGCSLIYDEDIARTLCSPSELKKTRNGQRRPNAREEWLDTQARALHQAAWLIRNAAKRAGVQA